jgi:uncharacterized membrane protein YhhN
MRAFVSISVIVSSVYLAMMVSHHANGSALSVVLKVASIGLLVVLAAVSHPRRNLLVAALASSAAGDFLLEVKHLGSLGPVQLFLFGLISFLLAHVFYVALLVKEKSRAPMSLFRKIAGPIVVFAVFSTLVALWHGLAEMRIPVLMYSIVLGAMATTALRSRFPSVVAIGALSFLASDTMLAVSIFGHPFVGSRALVWITYYAAQLMISVGVISAQKKLATTA